MSKRIKLKKTKFKTNKTKNKSILKKILYILTFVIILSFILISLFSKIANPILIEHANMETKRLSTIIINKAVSNQIVDDINLDELIITNKNEKGEIQNIDFNPYLINKFLNSIANTVQINLKYLQEGKVDLVDIVDEISVDDDKLKNGIIYEIPLGIITKNSFLSNLGPRIPVKLHLVGSVESSVKTDVKHYGINNAVIQISIHVVVNEQVNLPFTSDVIKISTDIPVAIKIIEGSVPNYYSNGISRESNPFSIAIEE